MLQPGDRATFRPDILRRLLRTDDFPVFRVLEMGPNPTDPARQVARVVDAHGFSMVLSTSLLAKLDKSR